jgi:hypothetical protein
MVAWDGLVHYEMRHTYQPNIAYWGNLLELSQVFSSTAHATHLILLGVADG